MSSEQMVAIVQRYFDAGNTGNLSLIDETISPDLAVHGPQETPVRPGQGREFCRHAATTFRAAYPDPKCTIEQSVVEGDRVAIAWTMTGTGVGISPVFNLADAGKKYNVFGITIYRIADGQIAELWQVSDMLGALKQLQG